MIYYNVSLSETIPDFDQMFTSIKELMKTTSNTLKAAVNESRMNLIDLMERKTQERDESILVTETEGTDSNSEEESIVIYETNSSSNPSGDETLEVILRTVDTKGKISFDNFEN